MHDYRWFEIQIQKMHVCEEDGFYSTADNIKRRLVHYARRRQSQAVIDLLRRAGVGVK